jgi:hypothetical protein
LTGQLVSARAALQLLRDRAQAARSDPKHWPEYAEYDCFACHRDIGSPELSRNGFSGDQTIDTVAWGTWYFSMTPEIGRLSPSSEANAFATALARLRAAMIVTEPDPEPVAGEVSATSDALDRWLRVMTAETRASDIGNLKRWVDSLKPGVSRVDEATQLYLALTPLRMALKNLDPGWDDGPVKAEQEALMSRLRSSQDFTPGPPNPKLPPAAR